MVLLLLDIFMSKKYTSNFSLDPSKMVYLISRTMTVTLLVQIGSSNECSSLRPNRILVLGILENMLGSIRYVGVFEVCLDCLQQVSLNQFCKLGETRDVADAETFSSFVFRSETCAAFFVHAVVDGILHVGKPLHVGVQLVFVFCVRRC